MGLPLCPGGWCPARVCTSGPQKPFPQMWLAAVYLFPIISVRAVTVLFPLNKPLMILLVIKVRQNVKLLMLSAFTLKIHIKSPSKIQTRSQTCKQFKKGVAVTVAEHRCKVDREKRSGNRAEYSPFLVAYSLPFPI